MTITRPTSRRSFLAAGTSAAIMAARASSATPPARVMVVGGTGRLGSIVVRRLLAGGIPVAFTTRSVDRVGMFGPGAQGVVADLNQRAGLDRAFAGCGAVFLIIANGDDETSQGLNCVAAMREAGVPRVVFLSVVRSVPHYDYKIPVEQALAGWGVPGAILRPNYFDQYDLLARRAILEAGVYPTPMGLVGVNRIDCRDIAEVAFQRLTVVNRRHDDDELHGPQALTGPEVAALYQAALGRPVRYFAELPETDRAQYVFTSERGRRIAAYWEAGLAKASPEAVAHTERLVGRPLRRFADFVPEAIALWRSGAEA